MAGVSMWRPVNKGEATSLRCRWQTKDFFVLFLAFQACCVQNARCALQALSIIGKPATQSGGYYAAGNAVDGSISTFSHGNEGDTHPWWRVDLGAEHCLGEITVRTRLGCCGEYRFAAAVARAGLGSNYNDNQPCGSPAARAQCTDGATIVFPCETPRMARYVTLDIDPSHHDVTKALLQLAEVTVKEYTNGECGAVDDTTTTALSAVRPTGKPCEVRTAAFQMLRDRSWIANSHLLSKKVVRSLMRCAGYCARDAHCNCFDFAPGNGQCRLHNLNSTYIEMMPNEEFAVYTVVDKF
ncbi:fucolectin-6-like [Acanthaster planci]|uniref:Fucolectin-6-like n=1 Tax=Acanthaster planci TaxID=133434 RepID=A0A8B7ZZE2_ACAPL|nr:fucolectin-6-like [Acanthaster planci]